MIEIFEGKRVKSIWVIWAIGSTALALLLALVSLGLTAYIFLKSRGQPTLQGGAAIISISKPPNSNDGQSRPKSDHVWTISARPPLTTNLGIGYIINSQQVQLRMVDVGDMRDVVIHDHVFAAPHIPDATRAVVTYEFNQPTIVRELEIIQHGNGVSQIEGFVGDSPESLTSIGTVFGPRHDTVTEFVEGESYIFAFSNNKPGRYFRFIVRKTIHPSGYALYRAFPRTALGVRIPPAQRVEGSVTKTAPR